MKAKWETVWGSTELVLSEGILPLLSLLLSILLTAFQSTGYVHMEPPAASFYPYLHSLLAGIALLYPQPTTHAPCPRFTTTHHCQKGLSGFVSGTLCFCGVTGRTVIWWGSMITLRLSEKKGRELLKPVSIPGEHRF